MLEVKDDPEDVSTTDVLQKKFKQFMVYHGKCQILIQNEQTRLKDNELAEKVDKEVHNISRRCNSWISKAKSPVANPSHHPTLEQRCYDVVLTF